MTPALFYLLKVVLCSGVLFGYYLLALRNRVFHQWNRFYLLAAVLFSLLFPLMPLPFFQHSATAGADAEVLRLLVTNGANVVVEGKMSAQWSLKKILPVLYAAVALVFALKLVLGLLQIRKLLRRSEVRQMEKILLVPTDHPGAPFSFFRWLFWKADVGLDTPGGQAVFRHELVHIREKHSLDKLLLQVVLLFFWANPFFWTIRRELQMIHEFIADKKAAGDAGTEALAAMILQSAYGKHYHQLVNPFFQTPIKRRLAMLQKTLQQPRNAYLGRMLTLPLCAVLFFAFSKKEKEQQPARAAFYAPVAATDTLPQKGKAANGEIKEVRINKKDSGATITITYKNGREETFTEKEARDKGLLSPAQQAPAAAGSPLVVLDGNILGTSAQLGNLDKLVPAQDIERIDVLKDAHATEKYGPRGASGAIEITTRKGAGASVPVFLETEQPPTFPGGEPAWRQFLQKNLNASVPVDKGAPAGAYTTLTQFQVAPDGTLSHFKSLTTHGYGMEAEVLALMQKSPKWEPAVQNGKKVTALHRQPITFVVAEEDEDMTITAKEIRIEGDGGNALLVVDGVEKGKMKEYSGNNFPVQPQQIESMNVLKGKSATGKYGDRGKDGVIEIITKKQ